MKILKLSATAGMLLAGASAGHALADDALRVCLAENIPPYSFRHDKMAGGFDLAVADAVAKHLGRKLEVQWFETEIDTDSSLIIQANALLSDGRCELIGGYPLYRAGLGRPAVKTGRLPGFDGAKPGDRRRQVVLGELVPSKPYFFAPLTVVLSEKAATKSIASLADLDGLRLGAYQGSLSDIILMGYEDGKYVDQIAHFIPGSGELFPKMEAGDVDATLIELRSFDDYRNNNASTKLKPSGYFHKIGFNMGYVGLATNQSLIDAVNAALDDIATEGDLELLGKSNGMTYVPPAKPDVLETISVVDLMKD